MSSLLNWFPAATFAPANDAAPAVSCEWWDQWLKKNVSASGVVDYKSMKADQAALETFIHELGLNVPSASASKNEQFAYWINLYNAATVELVLQHYPVKSIRDINKGKPWDLPFITVDGKKYSLNNIEHDILRSKFADPRIHFAINCASRSCPKLMNGAFIPDKLESQLNALTKSFINDTAKNKITATQIDISEIFNWYQQDFMQKGSVIDFLNSWSATPISATASIHYLNYDWSLNESL
ncbi:MAG: DUF547 domain-containing protein [Chitinophagales bacterium]